MAVRDSMAGLLRRTRRLIGDVGAVTHFSDETIQDALDARRQEARYVLLTAREFLNPGGSIVYKDFYSDFGDWESDAQLFDAAYNVMTPDVSEWIVGHWQFTEGQLPLAWIVGKTCDVHGAAATLLEDWAAETKARYDFSTQGGNYKISQAHGQMLTQAEVCWRKARPVTVQMVRGDVDGGMGNAAFAAAIHRILTNPF